MKPIRCIALASALAVVVLGCDPARKETQQVPSRPIEDVLRDHTPELMRLPGVVGTFEGATKNGERCIKVMVKGKTKELERVIPKELEGWRVEIEVTGEIRPLGGAPPG